MSVRDVNQSNLISYGMVRDYCNNADEYPRLAYREHDLKDFQRPWAINAIRELLPPGSRLLEVGSGEPLAAEVLAGQGYEITVVDPLEGDARGPQGLEEIQSQFPQVRIIRKLFTTQLAQELKETFDCVFSISVLEHIPADGLVDLFAATRMVLKPGGFSIHAVDHVLKGQLQEFHEQQLLRVFQEQNTIAESGFAPHQLQRDIQQMLSQSREDLETFYLSAAGHNLWRGKLKYEDYRFRKCISVQFIAQRPETAALLRSA